MFLYLFSIVFAIWTLKKKFNPKRKISLTPLLGVIFFSFRGLSQSMTKEKMFLKINPIVFLPSKDVKSREG